MSARTAEIPVADAAVTDALIRLGRRLVPGAERVAGVERLSGGASQETWSFAVVAAGRPTALILRRAPARHRAKAHDSPGLRMEARLMELAGRRGVPSPRVLHVLTADDQLGEGFVMDHVPGETIPRRILRDPALAAVRERLAFDLGTILAGIHGIETATLGALRRVSAASTLAELRSMVDADGSPRPVFELAFRWLERHAGGSPGPVTLVHGDFRNGNLIVGADGVRAVLDWELAHLGDPMEDLGWLCVNSWRFGMIDKPVGGFGPVSDLIAGYESAGGGAVDRRRVAFWETLGTLRWGVICLRMLARYESGEDRSVEPAMIGRRLSETEIDLLRIIAPRR